VGPPNVWKRRCTSVHSRSGDIFSLSHEYALQETKSYMQISPDCLSNEERYLHRNVEPYLEKAEEVTIVRWYHLIGHAREEEIR